MPPAAFVPVAFALALLLGAGPVSAAAPIHLADWRRYFHGEPEPPPKAPPPKQLAVVSAAAPSAADPVVQDFLRALAAAINAREGAALRARLSDRYAIEGLPEGSKAPDVFVQAVERIPGPTQIVVLAVEIRPEGRTAKAEFRYGASPPKLKTFRFDATGRLLASDLFAVRTERHGSGA